MLNEDIMGYMLSNEYKTQEDYMKATEPVKPDISEKEALEIFNEILDVFIKHNVSYQCACRLSLALNDAFMTGAVELYEREHLFPNGNL